MSFLSSRFCILTPTYRQIFTTFFTFYTFYPFIRIWTTWVPWVVGIAMHPCLSHLAHVAKSRRMTVEPSPPSKTLLRQPAGLTVHGSALATSVLELSQPLLKKVTKVDFVCDGNTVTTNTFRRCNAMALSLYHSVAAFGCWKFTFLPTALMPESNKNKKQKQKQSKKVHHCACNLKNEVVRLL